MNKDNIYNIAVECKSISDKEIGITTIVNRNSVSKFVSGNIKTFENALQKLCNLIKPKYPQIYYSLKKHMDDYNKNTMFHIGAIDAILDCIIEFEKPNITLSDCSKKIFISHATDDATIINAFVKELLIMGCGFEPDDIFCTLNHTSIRTGDDFRNVILSQMKCCDYVFCFISENYKGSEVCQNELGAAWALNDKRVLPFKFPNLSFNEMGFLSVVKQGSDITDKTKLDELYGELCEYYGFKQDWKNYNQRTADFIDLVNKTML